MSDDIPVLVFTTVGSTEDAERIARALVDGRFAACVNLIDSIRSIYQWKDAVQDDREVLLVIKTAERRVPALRAHLLSIHRYEVPEFVVVRTSDVSEAYGRWLSEACREADDR